MPESLGSSVPPVSQPKKYRPETKFHGRRVMILLFLVVVIVMICMTYAFTLSNPTKGLDKIASASVGSPTGSSVSSASQVVQPQPAQLNSLVTSVRCRAVGDVPLANGLLPNYSQVVVSGWSWSNGGMVFVADPANVGWLTATLINCPQNVVALERPYFASPTPTASVTPTVIRQSAGAPVVRYVQITATPGPIVPVVSPTLSNAVYLEGDCVSFNVWGVRSIFINGGTPVAGGSRVCDVKSFTVNK